MCLTVCRFPAETANKEFPARKKEVRKQKCGDGGPLAKFSTGSYKESYL